MIGDYRRAEKSRDLEPAVSVGGDHHGHLDTLEAESGDAPGPFSFDGRSPFELQSKLGEKGDGFIEGLHDDADVIHSEQIAFRGHLFSIESKWRRGRDSNPA